LVTAEKCIPVSNPASTKQQRRLGITGRLELRPNGLVAAHKTGGNGRRVLMQNFTGQPNQKWHTHPSS
jgi:hypothetical protein